MATKLTSFLSTNIRDATSAGRTLLTAANAGAQRTALDAQQTLVSGTNIKTINGNSLLGSGNVTISATPAGSGTEIQYKNGSSLGAISGSSVSGSNVTFGGTVRATTSLIIDTGNSFTDYTLTRNGTTGLLSISSPQGGEFSGVAVSALSFDYIMSNANYRDFYVRFGANDVARYLIQRNGATGILDINGNQVGFNGLNLMENSEVYFDARPLRIGIYNDWTDTSNYERVGIEWSSNVCTMQMQAAGTGTRRDFNLILRPSSSLTPANNGDLAIQATSNTSLTFKYKGSDGTVRSGSITLS